MAKKYLGTTIWAGGILLLIACNMAYVIAGTTYTPSLIGGWLSSDMP